MPVNSGPDDSVPVPSRTQPARDLQSTRQWFVYGTGVILTTAGLITAEVRGLPLVLIVAGCVAFLFASTGKIQKRSLFSRFSTSTQQAQTSESRDHTGGREEIADFEELRRQTAAHFDELAERLNQRERSLTERFVKFQEILEYPVPDVHEKHTSTELRKLSEHDREVHRILEAEAERVYEKIRNSGYLVNGKVDVAAIRAEVLELIQRIARVYSPGSAQPLLETSFEQIARAASRIFLHILVLVEQLPVNVQEYNIVRLHDYFRRAVVGYGAYKQAAPWLSYMTRGVYAGRMISASSPVTLGAWWLATEIGKRGAQKFVEKYVDRQAIAILHDIVNVIGVEVANVYGSGFRYRDSAWILGTELVELISRFPLSRESLRNGLREVTELPLRNEYDRIYLYRCLASHQSASPKLPDSSVLTRGEREQIAAKLEAFFANSIHGSTPAEVERWRASVEDRLDLRLQLTLSAAGNPEPTCPAILQLAVFLSSVATAERETIPKLVQSTRLFEQLPREDKDKILAEVGLLSSDARFEPPPLDPSSPITRVFLEDLFRTTIQVICDSAERRRTPENAESASLGEEASENLSEDLVSEVGAYYRISRDDCRTIQDGIWREHLTSCASAGIHLPSAMSADAVRRILRFRDAEEEICWCFPDISVPAMESDSWKELPDAWYVGFRSRTSGRHRSMLLTAVSTEPLWVAEGLPSVIRQRGIFVDSAGISGGRWLSKAVQLPGSEAGGTKVVTTGKDSKSGVQFLVSGHLRGGRYSVYFEPLLKARGE
ncbi:MAG: hypothetical protein ACK526_07410 [Planctomyces sp.]